MTAPNTTSPFESVPDPGTKYDVAYLLAKMPSDRLQATPLLYTKISTQDLLYVLAALKHALGKDLFDSTVGLRNWDVGLVMIDTTPLDDAQLISALMQLKTLLMQHNVTPDDSFTASTVDITITHLCQLHLRMRNTMHGYSAAVPKWDEITPNMHLKCY